MRLGAPRGMKMGFGWEPRADGSVCATSIVRSSASPTAQHRNPIRPPRASRLLRRRSVTDTAIRPSRFGVRQKVVPLPTRVSLPCEIYVVTGLCRPPSNRLPTMLVAQTDPSARGCQLNPIFMPCGAPKAHDVFHELTGQCALILGRCDQEHD